MQKRYILCLFVLYSVGILGILSSQSDFFKGISYLQILVTSFIVLIHSNNSDFGFWVRLAIITFSCFLIEVLGVKTGFPFGDYSYGDNLGLKFLEVPLLIGLNWSVLIYSSAQFFSGFLKNRFLSALCVAASLIALDSLIEPLASELGYWYWGSGSIPYSNYFAWFVLSFSFSFLLRRSDRKKNDLASVNLAFMYLFFIILNYFIQP